MDLRRAARWPRCNCLRNEHLAQTPIWLPVFLVILNPASLNCRICPVCSQIISWQSPACSASQETIFQAPLSSGLSTESMGSEAEKKEKPLNWVSLSLSLLASFQQLQLTVHRTGLYVMTAISLSASELCELCFLFPCSGLIVTALPMSCSKLFYFEGVSIISALLLDTDSQVINQVGPFSLLLGWRY